MGFRTGADAVVAEVLGVNSIRDAANWTRLRKRLEEIGLMKTEMKSE
jgi:hypothetical protein